MKMKAILVCAFLLAVSTVDAKRDGKFFFVSTTSSTSVTTTTSFQSGTFSCLVLSSTTYSACQGRRKRSLISGLSDPISEDELQQISASRASRDLITVPDLTEGEKKSASNREGRFAWYYMTTTLTSTSTSTSTSTTYTSTVSVSAIACTPNNFVACG